MAEQVLKIKIQGDTTELGKALKQTNAEIEQTLNVITSLGKALASSTFNVTKLANELTTALAKIAKVQAAALNPNIARATSFKEDTLVQYQKMNDRLADAAEARRKKQVTAETIKNDAVLALQLSLNSKLLAMETALAEGVTKNIGAIKAKRTAAIREAEAEINRLEEKYHKLTTGKASFTSGFTGVLGGIASVGDTKPKDVGGAVKQGFSFTGGATRLKEANQELEEHTRKHKNLVLAIGEAVGIYRVWVFTLNSVINAIKAVPKVGIELEATIASLSSTMGSEAGAFSALKGLNQEAQRTGISISALRESFRTFQASTSLAGESLESTWRMFTNINTVSSALHLTTDKTNSVFLALAQIFNKSKVQSEELVKQLGNLLPGAFASFAAANKDMFKNTQDLIAKMKLGVVTARETVEKFTEYLANRFSQAFNIASQGLNANVGRLQTSFTLLGEAIYSSTRGPMLDFVKGLTSVVDYLRAGVEGTNNLGAVLQQGLVIAMGAAAARVTLLIARLIDLRLGAAATVTVMGSLKAAMAFLSTPTAIITGIGLVVAEILHLKNVSKEAQESITEFYENYNKQTENLSEAAKLKIEVDADPAVKGVKDAITTVEQEIAKLEKTNKGLEIKKKLGLLSTEDQEALTNLRYNYAIRADLEEKLEEQRATSLLKIQTKAETANIEAMDAYATKRKELEIAAERSRGNEVGAARKQVEEQFAAIVEDANKKVEALSKAPSLLLNEQAQEDLEKAKKVIQDYNDTLANAGVNKQLKENLSDAKDSYKVITQDLQTMREEFKSNFESIDSLYEQNLISFTEYADRKKERLAEQLKAELLFQNEIKAIAEGSGDLPKAKEASENIEQLKLQNSRELAKLEADRLKNSFDNAKILKDLTMEYYSSIGNQEASVKLQLEEKYGLLKNSLKEQIDLGNVSRQQDLERIQVIENIALAEAKVVAEKERLAANEASYTENINRVNILKNIGSISELTAAKQMTSLNEEAIKFKERQIELAEQSLANFPKESDGYKRIQREIAQAKQELESFKLTADTVALYFDKVLGDAFEKAFVGFATGSMNAKQAFSAFATSIVADIAKIAAQEARSALIGGLFKMGFSAIGGMFSGGSTSVAAGNSASFSNWFNSPGLANGGATTGLSSVSGSVLTSPTYFPSAKVIPFASGGVLAGEAGAEAVLPLKRGKSGKLGVAMEASAAGGNVININVSVDRSQGEDNSAYAARIAETIAKRVAKEEIANAARPGNINNRVTKFG